jgi:NifU-like protein involved in Fe-S cluster formation
MEDATVTGQVGNVKCGDVMKLFLKIEQDKIVDASVQTYGCVAAISASDALCEILIGKTVAEAKALTFNDVMVKLGDVPQVKVHCSQLGIESLKKALENYDSGKNTGRADVHNCEVCGSCSRKKGVKHD